MVTGRPKRILVVTPLGSQPWSSNGELVTQLRAFGHDVIVAGEEPAAAFPWPAPYRPSDSFAARTGIGLAVNRLRRGLAWLRGAREFIRQHPADVVLVWEPALALVCRLARPRGSRVAFVLSEYPPKERRRRVLRAAAASLADAVVVPNSAASSLNLARHVVALPYDGGAAPRAQGEEWVVFGGGPATDEALAALALRDRQRPAAAVIIDGRDDAEIPDIILGPVQLASGSQLVERALDAGWIAAHRVKEVVDPTAVLWSLDHRHRAAFDAGIRVFVSSNATVGAAVLATGVTVSKPAGSLRELSPPSRSTGALAEWARAALTDPCQPRADVVAELGVAIELCPMCGGGARREVRRVGPTSIFDCGSCSVTYASPKVPDDVVYSASYHDGSGDFGTDYVHAQWYCEQLSDDRLRCLARAGVPTGSMVDLGTGLGHFVQRARDAGWRCDGVELVPEAVQGARDLYGLELINEGIFDFAPATKYGVAALGQTLEHFTAPVELLEHIRKEVITPGGVVLIEVPHLDGLPRRIRRGAWSHWQPGDHVLFLTRKSLAELLDRAGFDVVRSETVSGVYPGLGAVGVAYGLGLFDPLSMWGSASRSARRLLAARLARVRGDAHVPTRAALSQRRTGPTERALLALATLVDHAGLGDHLRVVARAR